MDRMHVAVVGAGVFGAWTAYSLLETGARSASWIDAVYLLCYLMLIASAELYLRHPVPRPGCAARPGCGIENP